MASIDAHLRLLAPGKVSKDDKLVDFDALLLDRFFKPCMERIWRKRYTNVMSCRLNMKVATTLKSLRNYELGCWGFDCVVAKFLSHMLNLANLAEELGSADCD